MLDDTTVTHGTLPGEEADNVIKRAQLLNQQYRCMKAKVNITWVIDELERASVHV